MTFEIAQNDTSPTLVSTLMDGHEPIDLSNATEIRFYMENEFKQVVISEDLSGNVNPVALSDGRVEYIFTEEDTAETGWYEAEWQITYNDDSVETYPVDEKIDVHINRAIA